MIEPATFLCKGSNLNPGGGPPVRAPLWCIYGARLLQVNAYTRARERSSWIASVKIIRQIKLQRRQESRPLQSQRQGNRSLLSESLRVSVHSWLPEPFLGAGARRRAPKTHPAISPIPLASVRLLNA